MRIVAGRLRGKTIQAPAGTDTRPTTDRVREALFSSLYSLRSGFEGAVVLDAFAGSGALGLEALSRGADKAVFYERDRKALKVIEANCASCGIDAAQAQLVKRDVLACAPVSHRPAFDLVFLDPPYAFKPDRVCAMVRELSEAGALGADAIVVYECAIDAADAVRDALEQVRVQVKSSKKYGKTAVIVGIIG